jgi:hypothetical protein
MDTVALLYAYSRIAMVEPKPRTAALCNARMLDAFLFESANLFTELGRSAPSIITGGSPDPASSSSSTTTSATRAPLPPSLHPQPDVVRKLENMGFYVGRRLVERHTRHRNLNLDNNYAVMKYLCKDFWQLAFMHVASKLQTNHRGIFVVDDDSFQWLSAIGPVEGCDSKEAALKYLIFPCGVLRGALYSLGVAAVVNGKVEQLPKVQFNVQCNPMVNRDSL